MCAIQLSHCRMRSSGFSSCSTAEQRTARFNGSASGSLSGTAEVAAARSCRWKTITARQEITVKQRRVGEPSRRTSAVGTSSVSPSSPTRHVDLQFLILHHVLDRIRVSHALHIPLQQPDMIPLISPSWCEHKKNATQLSHVCWLQGIHT